MNDAIVLVVAAGFALIGAGALARPAMVLGQFGVAVETPDGRNEVRAVYGGFGIAIAVVLTVAALGDPASADGIVLAVGVALLGMAGGRVVSALIDWPAGFFPVGLYFAIEAVSGAALLLTR